MLAEVQSYLDHIAHLRRQVGEIIANLSTEVLNWQPIEGVDDHATNSLAVLAAHVAGAEHFWITEVVGGRPATRNRSSEFVTKTENGKELLEKLTAVSDETHMVLSSLTNQTINEMREINGRFVSVRWCILHVIDHTALHLGHMQMTYQSWKTKMYPTR